MWADLCICEEKCNECVRGLIYEGMCMYKNVFEKMNDLCICADKCNELFKYLRR